jgi:MarR family transcriptional regulator, temperature-dependent positive regulator of motility
MSVDANDQLRRSPIHLLHRAGQSAEVVFDAEMARAVTPRQFAVMMTVARSQGLSQTGIVDATGIDRSTLAELVPRLVKRGLLQRKRTKEDARAYAVRLTKDGRRVLDRAEPLAKSVDEKVLGALPARQREEFMTALLTIVETLERVAPQGKGPT